MLFISLIKTIVFQKDCIGGYLKMIPKEKSIAGVSSYSFSVTLTNAKNTNLGASIKTGVDGRKDFKNLRNVVNLHIIRAYIIHIIS
jgi:hypothetical protein